MIKMYKKVPGGMNFAEREKEVLSFWKENDIFSKTIENRKGNEVFTFFDGPPTANGRPHVGHVLTRAIKDLIPRYKTMKGYNVLRKAGWDTHGLPVELEVEKSLGIDGKNEIENYGIDKFNEKCKESVWKYKSEWEQMSNSIGYWADMENPYITYDNNYIESVWWALKNISDKGLLYKGHKIVPYCPRCGTSLSSHEVSQGYKEVEENSIFVKFKLKDRENTYIIAWTTTPWTLPSNVALTVNPDIEYAEVNINNETLIISKAFAESTIIPENEDAKIIKTMLGSELYEIEYEPLFNFVNPDKKAWFVVTDTFVTTSEGTGIVHTAPAFGEDDAKVGRKYNLPFIQLVDSKGCFPEEVTLWKGKFVKDADPLIIKYLKENGKIFKILKNKHTYPFCWRCDTPLLYYALDTWFIEMTKVKENLIKNNNSINWIPENIKDGRMGNFLSNVIDWGLSRSRYWGTPLPVWECECGHFHVIGSRKELEELTGADHDIELHRPYVDNITMKCEKCGKDMKRVTDVIDCWFDSGSMPFAQWHYPFENKELFEERFPANFISEAIDQTRGWFYTLLAISTVLFDRAPFENCIVLGHVNDKNGIKMSKHKGNVVNPETIIEKQGADAVRWYFYVNSAPWLPSRFYEEAISEIQRKFLGTLWNVYSFFVLYANIDNFNPNDFIGKEYERSTLDKWILSRLNTLIKNTDENLNSYKLTDAAREIQNFVDDLSNWYIRRGRERYWGSEYTNDKISAYMTLYEVLVTLSKLIAPFVPFISEQIYQNLVLSVSPNEPISVHLCDYPKYDDKLIDKELERNMNTVLSLVFLGRSCRNSVNIKNRQPLSTIFIKSNVSLPEEYIELVLDELNIKKLEFLDSFDQFVDYKFKPQLKTVGPKYGKFIPSISKYLSEITNGKEIMDELNNNGSISFNIDGGTEIKLGKDDLLIESTQAPGFVFDSDNKYEVVIDIEITHELEEEGFVREIISKVQTMRKEFGLEVIDHINVLYSSGDKIENAINNNIDEIKKELLADSISFDENQNHDAYFNKEWTINGEHINISISKA